MIIYLCIGSRSPYDFGQMTNELIRTRLMPDV